MSRINNANGHRKGDEVIAGIASRLRGGVPGARVYRVGGDEFLVEVPRPIDGAEATALGSRIAALAEEPFAGVVSPVRLRVAVDRLPVGRDVDGAWRRLDLALWQQAREGGVAVTDAEVDARGQAGSTRSRANR